MHRPSVTTTPCIRSSIGERHTSNRIDQGVSRFSVAVDPHDFEIGRRCELVAVEYAIRFLNHALGDNGRKVLQDRCDRWKRNFISDEEESIGIRWGIVGDPWSPDGESISRFSQSHPLRADSRSA